MENQTENKLIATNIQNQKETSVDTTTHAKDSSEGTHMVNVDIPRTVTKDQAIITLNTRANAVLNDDSWSLMKQLKRNNYIGTIAWTPTSNRLLLESDVPWGLLRTALATSPFALYSFSRFKYARIHMQVQGVRFATGRLLAYFVPTCLNTLYLDAAKREETDQNAFLLQHMILDPSMSEPGDFLIPFTFNKSWLSEKSLDTLGQFKIIVWNPLTVAAGTTSTVTIRLYVTFEEAEFKIPLMSTTQDIGTRIDRIIDGHKQAALLGDISEVLEEGTKALLPIAQIVDTVGTILDKKQIGIQYPPLVMKDQQFMTNSKNDEFIERLSFNPNEMQLTDAEHYGTKINEMSMNYLMKGKWNYIYTARYSEADSVGDVLWANNVGPMANVTENSTNLTTIDFCSRKFQYWRGGFLFGFEFVTSPLHEGRVTVAFLPGEIATNFQPTDYAKLQSQYMATFQLRGGQNNFTVRVPYLAATPYKKVFNGNEKAFTEQLYFNEYFSGAIVLLVDTNLKTTTNMPTSVPINIYLAAANDYELDIPTMTNSSIGIDNELLLDGVKQSKKVDTKKPISFNDPPRSQEAVVLCANQTSHTFDPDNAHFGDHCSDFQQMLKRYQTGISLTGTLQALQTSGAITQDIVTKVQQGAPLIMPISECSLIPDSVNVVYSGRNLTSEIASIFRLCRMPLVYKIKGLGFSHGYITYVNEWYNTNTIMQLQDLAILFNDPEPGDYKLVGGPITPLAYISPTHTAEFKLPFMTDRATNLIRKPYDTNINLPEFNHTIPIIAFYGLELTKPFTIHVNFSMADEATMGLFCGLPKIKFEVDETGKSLFPDYWVTPALNSIAKEKVKQKENKENKIDLTQSFIDTYQQLSLEDLENIKKVKTFKK